MDTGLFTHVFVFVKKILWCFGTKKILCQMSYLYSPLFSFALFLLSKKATTCGHPLWSPWHKRKVSGLHATLWTSFVLPRYLVQHLVPTEVLSLKTLPTPLVVKLVTVTYKLCHAVMTNILVYVSEIIFLFVLWISMSQLWASHINCLYLGSGWWSSPDLTHWWWLW